MRRGASLSAENSTEISTLKNELSAMKKSIEGVTGLQESVDTLQLQTNTHLAWQADVVNPQLHRVRENAEEIQPLKKQVGQLREQRPAVESRMDSGMKRSQLDEWLEQSFEPVRVQASHALPRSELDEYVASMEGMEGQLKVRASRVRVDRNAATGDTGMRPEKTIGIKEIHGNLHQRAMVRLRMSSKGIEGHQQHQQYQRRTVPVPDRPRVRQELTRLRGYTMAPRQGTRRVLSCSA